MNITVDKAWRVRASSGVDIPLPAHTVWGHMRDFRRFLSLDPLHVRVLAQAPAPGDTGWPRGATIVIPHRLLGVGPDRIGRVLTWREGCGFAISDLSARGVRYGFPHVCMYELTPLGASACRLAIETRGRWTATWTPRALVKAWLWWVLVATQVSLAQEMRRVRRAMHARFRMGVRPADATPRPPTASPTPPSCGS